LERDGIARYVILVLAQPNFDVYLILYIHIGWNWMGQLQGNNDVEMGDGASDPRMYYSDGQFI
jgi:hypothetical protein